MPDIENTRSPRLSIQEKRNILNKRLKQDLAKVITLQRKPDLKEMAKATILNQDKRKINAFDPNGNIRPETEAVIRKYLQSEHINAGVRLQLDTILDRKREDDAL